jgi:peptidyl-prolyl cis-trans isomerase D
LQTLLKNGIMAVIGTIRKRSGLLIIIVGVALAAFVLGDFLNPKYGRGRQNIPLAIVLGEDIPYSQFDAKFEQNQENQKRNQQKESLTADELFNIRQQTWDQLVQGIVLNEQYKELGLVISAEELFDQIQGDEPHAYILQYFKDPETQKYDPELVRNYIKQLGQMDPTNRTQWDAFVEAIKDDRYKTKYKNLISKAYIMPEQFVRMDFEEKKTNANIRLVGYRYNLINDSLVKVTDKDFEKYYDDYKQNYKQEASRDIDYVAFDVKPSAKDRKEIRDEVYKIYEAFKTTENVAMFVSTESENKYDSSWHKQGTLSPRIDTVIYKSPVGTFIEPYLENDAWHMAKLMDVQMRPDSMKASHILISYKGAANAKEDIKRTKERAKIVADSLYNVVKSSPSLIETLAKLMSDDPSAQTNSGDLGWFADGSMVYPFNNAVLTNKVGDLVVAESIFGYHIIKVTGKLEPVKKARVAVIDVSITPSQETNQEVFAKASEFQGKATTLTSFDTLSTRMGVNKLSATYLQAMGNRISGLDYPRPIIQWTFIEGIGVGSVSQVFTMENKYVVAIVTKVREKGIPKLEDIKDVIQPLIIKEMKGEIAVRKMKELVGSATNLNDIALRLNSKVDTIPNVNFNTRNIGSYGNEANVVAEAFTLQPNVLSEPIKGNNAAFYLIVDQVTKPDEGEDRKAFEKQLVMNFKSKVNNNTFNKTLEEKADVVDNRVKFY